MVSPVAMSVLRTLAHSAIPLTRNAIMFASLVLCAARGSFAEYRIERIASGQISPEEQRRFDRETQQGGVG